MILKLNWKIIVRIVWASMMNLWIKAAALMALKGQLCHQFHSLIDMH